MFLINVYILGKIQEVKSTECSYLIYTYFSSFHRKILIHLGNPGFSKVKMPVYV